MSGAFDDDRDADLEAAEYVLGTLDAHERSAFGDRLRHDTTMAFAVAGWEARLAGLGGRLDPVAPPQQIWERIERAISTAGPSGAATIPFKVIPGGGRQAPDTNALKRSRNRWRTGALLSGTLAAALLVALADRVLRTPATTPEEAGSTYVAAVNRGGDKPALIVRVDLKSGQVMVRPIAATTPAGHSLELWYIGDDKSPRSMGVVERDPMRWTLPEGASGAATFAISVEPKGGSKTGAPTGPVVYSGQLVKE